MKPAPAYVSVVELQVAQHVARTATENARAFAKWKKGDKADFVFKVSGGSEQRVPCDVLAIHPASVEVMLSRDVVGFGSKRQVRVSPDRLARRRGKT